MLVLYLHNSHALGVHEEYHLVLRAIDEAIGNYIDAVQASGNYKSYTYAVISDHVRILVAKSHSKYISALWGQ